MKFFYMILVFQILIWKTFSLEIIDLTNTNNNEDIIDLNEHNDNNNYDFNYLSNEKLDISSKTTPKMKDYQYQDLFEIPINNKNYDYEFAINQYSEPNKRPTTSEKKLIYVPVDYSIEFRKDRFEYSTRRSPTTLASIMLTNLLNSTKLRSNETIRLNNSNLTNFNQTHNGTRIQLATISLNLTRVGANLTNSTNTTKINFNTTSATATTTTEKKSSFEKTFLKLESNFDETYDIDAIPRRSGMLPNVAHLIEKRIHSHNEKMSRTNTKDFDDDGHDNELYHHHHHFHNYNTSHALDSNTYMLFLYIMIASLFFILLVLLFCRKNATITNLS